MTVTFDSRIARSANVRDEPLEFAFERRDTAAYETAYARFGGRLYATALRLLRDAETARECVHDVFLHVWHRESAYSAARGSLEAFLVTCVRNRALMQLRSSARGRESVKRLDPPGEYTLEDDPIERERIGKALAALTKDQADVVQLAYYRGMTLAEVAAHLAIPLGTVKTRLSAALRALRRSLIPQAVNGT
ncbi:MAG TPA: sigma-70 family RNA polymerase sigma factor [Candidatus Cybelea sp.]